MQLKYLFLIGLLITSIAVAEVQTLGTFKEKKNIELKQIGTSDYTGCNITSVSYPNSSKIIQDVKMSKNGNEYSYTLGGRNTSGTYGQYIVNGECYDGTDYDIWSYDFYVTPSGNKDLEEGGGLASVGLIFAIIAAAFFFMIFSFKFSESDNLFPVSLLFMGLSFILTLYSIYLGYIYSEAVLYSIPVAGGQNAIFQGVLWAMVSLIVVGMIFLTIKVIKMYNIKKLQKEYGNDYNPDMGYETLSDR